MLTFFFFLELKPTAMRIRIDLLKSRFEYLITMFGPTILEHPNILSLVALPKKKINQLFEKDSFVNNLHHNLENNIYFKFWTNTGKLKFEKKKKYESLSKLVGISQLQIKRQLKNHPFKSYVSKNRKKLPLIFFMVDFFIYFFFILRLMLIIQKMFGTIFYPSN